MWTPAIKFPIFSSFKALINNCKLCILFAVQNNFWSRILCILFCKVNVLKRWSPLSIILMNKWATLVKFTASALPGSRLWLSAIKYNLMNCWLNHKIGATVTYGSSIYIYCDCEKPIDFIMSVHWKCKF